MTFKTYDITSLYSCEECGTKFGEAHKPNYKLGFACKEQIREITLEAREKFEKMTKELYNIWHDKTQKSEVRKAARILYMSCLGGYY